MPLDCAIGRIRIKSLVSVAEGSHYSPELFRMLTGKTPDTGHPKYEKYLLHRITKTVGLEIISVNWSKLSLKKKWFCYVYIHHNLCTSVFLNRGLDYASPPFLLVIILKIPMNILIHRILFCRNVFFRLFHGKDHFWITCTHFTFWLILPNWSPESFFKFSQPSIVLERNHLYFLLIALWKERVIFEDGMRVVKIQEKRVACGLDYCCLC